MLPVLAIAGILAAGGSGKKSEEPATLAAQAPGHNQIFMYADRYEPRTLTVKRGDEVTFVNKDTDDHWPASDDHPSHQLYSEFDPKKPIGPDSSWGFVFERAGQWGLHDHLFPKIGGKITVTP